ncbi:MAG: TadE family protein [Bryobacteraceae bacterium]|jgi:hypothetical protein
MKKKGRQGSAIVEFALLSPFLFGTLIGLWVYGPQLISNLQIVQTARDVASMYSRGVDFSTSTNQAMITRLGEQLGLQSTGGNGVVILSTVQFIGPLQCAQFSSDSCGNSGKWAFTNRIVFGNTSLRSSNLGNTTCTLNTDGSLNLVDTVTNGCAAVPNTALLGGLGTPNDSVNGFKPGQDAYVVEVAANTGWTSAVPWTSSVGYAFAIF